MGVSTAASRSELVLGDATGLLGRGALAPRLTRRSWSAALEYRVDETLTLAGAAGATVDGALDLGGERFALEPGFIAVVAMSRVMPNTAPYFVITGWSVGVSSVPTRSAEGMTGQLTAGDVRFNVTAGRMLLDTLAPFAVLRLFGGPVIWERDGQPLAGGTDRYHVQAGLGLLVATPAGLDAFAEIAPVGERAVTVGAGFGF